jgi:hypothetical protein
MDHKETEYLKFLFHQPPDRKTVIVSVFNKRSNSKLGSIRWYGAWRQYCFHPESQTIFNRGCLIDINQVIDDLMDKRSFVTDPTTGEELPTK